MLRVSEISFSIIVAPKHKFLMLKVVVAGRGELGEGPKSWLAGNRVTQQ